MYYYYDGGRRRMMNVGCILRSSIFSFKLQEGSSSPLLFFREISALIARGKRTNLATKFAVSRFFLGPTSISILFFARPENRIFFLLISRDWLIMQLRAGIRDPLLLKLLREEFSGDLSRKKIVPHSWGLFSSSFQPEEAFL